MTTRSNDSQSLQAHDGMAFPSTLPANRKYTEDYTDSIRKRVSERAHSEATESISSSNTTDARELVAGPDRSDTTSESARVEQNPSIEDALSTGFIDVRSAETIQWPIRGAHKWEGRVIEIGDEVFTAELTPLGDGDRSAIIAEFRNGVLNEDGQIQSGDLFYVTEQRVRFRGILTTQYSFRLRISGNWTFKDIQEINERSQRRWAMLQDNVE